MFGFLRVSFGLLLARQQMFLWITSFPRRLKKDGHKKQQLSDSSNGLSANHVVVGGGGATGQAAILKEGGGGHFESFNGSLRFRYRGFLFYFTVISPAAINSSFFFFFSFSLGKYKRELM